MHCSLREAANLAAKRPRMRCLEAHQICSALPACALCAERVACPGDASLLTLQAHALLCGTIVRHGAQHDCASRAAPVLRGVLQARDAPAFMRVGTPSCP